MPSNETLTDYNLQMILMSMTSPAEVVSTDEQDNNVVTDVAPPGDRSCDAMRTNSESVIVSLKIFICLSVVFIIVGLVGNFISLAVFTSRDMRKISSNVYLLLLALSDSIYLISIFFRKTLAIFKCWGIIDWNYDALTHSRASCMTTLFFVDLASNCSSILILLFTIERFWAVYFPVHFKEFCNVRRSSYAGLLSLVFILLTTLPTHVALIDLNTTYNICSVVQTSSGVFITVENIVYRVVPAFIIIVFNSFIIIRVAQITKTRNKRRTASASVARNNAVTTTVSSHKNDIYCKKDFQNNLGCKNISKFKKISVLRPPQQTQDIEMEQLHDNKNNCVEENDRIESNNIVNNIKTNNNHNNDATNNKMNQQQQMTADELTPHQQKPLSPVEPKHEPQPHVQQIERKRKRKEDKSLQLTITLILVSSTYLIAFLPSFIYSIFDTLSLNGYLSIHKSVRRMAKNYTDLLFMTAFANNFFLYTLSGRIFREQIKKMFCFKRCCEAGVSEGACNRKNMTTTHMSEVPSKPI
ncbi:hypothetical protein HELRODRAFT_169408 [Helobdella robusta]|uniref:G-protein coupled receptors family 1 profile domain-containing protein n=1 Tax=Helobdella robusta TaxID=6412 RepID=T1F1W7_HELRO|nr:hypothetical protein HELRODRAFT_169408 [Helobdella robusta]ESO08541.1 hypothetical protein HELRODRAFT_169408 [Helobdella robusta]